MDKKHGSERPSGKGVQATPGKEAPGNSGQAGSGSGREGFYVDELGRTCYGSQCIEIAIDEQRREVVVRPKPDSTCDTGDFVEAVRRTLGKGARTVYEIPSEIKEDKPK